MTYSTKLTCCNDKTVLESKYSDHDFLLINTSYGLLCSFNILCQCKKTKFGYNNGFNLEENDQMYSTRLQGIIRILKEIKEKYNVVGFLLQETPHSTHQFYTWLKDALTGFDIRPNELCCKTERATSHTFATFNSQLFSKQTCQSVGRGQRITLTDKTNKSTTVFNLHSEYTQQNETAMFVLHAAQKGWIVAGDLNIGSGTAVEKNLINELNKLPNVTIESRPTTLFPVSTIDLCVVPNTAIIPVASVAPKSYSWPYPLPSCQQRPRNSKRNYDLYEVKFQSPEQARFFSDQLFYLEVKGRNFQPLYAQQDGLTVIIPDHHLDKAQKILPGLHIERLVPPCDIKSQNQHSFFTENQRLTAKDKQDIQTVISKLQDEIRSCWSFNKSRKQNKITALKALLEIDDKLQIDNLERTYSDLRKGLFWTRTADLLDRLKETTNHVSIKS